ncbi:unnamed protein product [Hydatigera taeniaeformis]|uniref:Eukaryotic translation initiation factor 3 30 kDa subunit n=1 Tax=Hydatigena taeniaeformis TaxID=6205 RepID=A0A0R3WTI1_HYDTA|nr:unnamed protein product [Hydatigera taeniaeformis]
MDDLKLDDDDSDDEEEFFKGENDSGATDEGYTSSRQRNGKIDEGSSESADGGDDDDDTVTLAPDDDSDEIGADEENEDNEDGEEDAEEEEGEEDEMVRLGLRPKYIKCPEDDEFVAELERMTAEAIMPGAGVPAGPTATVTSTAISGTASLLPSLESLGVGAAAARKAAARSAAAQTQSTAENIIAALESTTPRIATSPLNGDLTGNMVMWSEFKDYLFNLMLMPRIFAPYIRTISWTPLGWFCIDVNILRSTFLKGALVFW